MIYLDAKGVRTLRVRTARGVVRLVPKEIYTMRRPIALVLCCAVALAMCGCAKKMPPKKPVRIGIEVWAGYAYAYVAEEKGFFKDNGVDVKLVFSKNTVQSRDMFENGEIDGAFDVFPDVVTRYSKGIPARVVWVVDYSDSADVVVGKKELASMSDLKGKRVGVEGMNTFSHMLLLELLRKHGVKEEEVQFVNVNPLDLPAALDKNQVDAGHTWQPATSVALKKGYRIIAKAGEIPGIVTDVLAFSRKIIKDRPKDIEAVVKALSDARDYVLTHPKEAIKIMADRNKMTVQQLSSDLGGLHLLDLADNAIAMSRSNDPKSLRKVSATVTKFFMDRGQITYKPDVNELIEPRFVEDIKAKR